MAIIDKIQLSGTVYTIGNETTTAVTSASTDNEIPTAKAVYDAIPQGGGGKAIEAGTNISITTGETADTINCTLPIRTDGNYSGKGIILGNGNGMYSKGAASIVGGSWVSASTNAHFSVGFGNWINLSNEAEFSCGEFSKTNRASSTFGDSGNTLFSVGNGTADNARHNAFEIRQNGDIYITKDGQDVKLQDQLGGGGSSTYTAGDGININNDVISVTGKVDTSTYNTYTAATDTALASKQTTLTAGTGISIVDNVISATGGGGSVTIDPSLDSGSTNPVANSAITETLGKYYYPRKFNNSVYNSPWTQHSSNGCVGFGLEFANILNPNDSVISRIWLSKINGKNLFYAEYSAPNSDYFNLNLVETSAITTSVTSSSTDTQVPSAKAVYDQLGGLKLVKLTQSEYDALSPNYDVNTLYVING